MKHVPFTPVFPPDYKNRAAVRALFKPTHCNGRKGMQGKAIAKRRAQRKAA